jgi:hypothetical protein
MGNWLATVIGLVVGIPIALEIERSRSQRERGEKQDKILALVEDELNHNYTLISKSWVGKSPFERGAYLGGALKDDLWQAMSDSGEIQAISDVELLDKISNAYYYVRLLSLFAQNLFSAYLIQPSAAGETAMNHINSRADTFGGMAEVAIEAALSAIKDIKRGDSTAA